jgi:biopolymer transport protein ExbD
MITRPLDLASRLRPEPRNFDWLFLVNGGLIVLFFSLFGSRFVLAPGLGIDFELPRASGTVAGAAQTTHYVSVKRGGMLFVADRGQISLPLLREWLKEQAKVTKRPVLLVRADADVALSVLTDIFTAAREAGFEVFLAAQPVRAAPGEAN